MFLFAKSLEEFAIMQESLHKYLVSRYNWQWKADSLEVMCVHCQSEHDHFNFLAGDQLLRFRSVSSIGVLGMNISRDGSSVESFDFRLRQADKLVYKHEKLLKKPGPLGPRLDAWRSASQASAAYASGTYALTRALLVTARSWEFKVLRRILKVRRKPEEAFFIYCQRSAARIQKWLELFHVAPLHIVILRNVFRAVWKDHGANKVAAAIRDDRSRVWWTAHQNDPLHVRRVIGAVASRPGPKTCFEDVFVTAFGVDWRKIRDSCAKRTDWLRKEAEFIKKVCSSWALPCPAEGSPVLGFRLEATVERVPVRFSDPIPFPPDQPLDGQWNNPSTASPARSFEFVVDNQALANIMNGNAISNTEEYDDILGNLHQLLLVMLQNGMQSRLNFMNPVRWVPRQLNTGADHLCHCATDAADTNTHAHFTLEVSRTAAHLAAGSCFQAFSDGSFDGGSGSCACYVWAWTCDANQQNWQKHFLGYAAIFLPAVQSAFHAEVLALELAVKHLHAACIHSRTHFP